LNVERLGQIPGIGEKVSKSLIDHFGSEEKALKAIFEGRVTEIASAPGMSLGRAISVVKRAFELKEGVKLEDVLKTGDVRNIYDRVIKLIQQYACTNYAKMRLLLYYPLPASKIDKIKQRISYFTKAKTLVENVDAGTLSKFIELLSHVKPLRRGVLKERIIDRVIVTDSESVYNTLIRDGVSKYCNVFLLEPGSSRDEAIEYAHAYENVIFISTTGEYDDLFEYAENVQIMPWKGAVEEIIPERAISFYIVNYETVTAVCELAELLSTISREDLISSFTENLNLDVLRDVKETLTHLTNEGDIAPGYDAEYDRYKKALQIFNDVIAEAELWANEQIKKKVTSSKVTIKGEQILRILESADAEAVGRERLKQYLPSEILDIFSDIIKEAEDMISEKLNLKHDEAFLVEDIFPSEIRLPVEVSRKGVQMLEENLRSKFAQLKLSILRKLSEKLAKNVSEVQKAVKSALEFDLFLAVGRFSKDYHLNPPVIYNDKIGVGFKNGVNIFLREEEIKGKTEVEPVNYVVGDVPFTLEGADGEKIIVLTGANSGGKSTCIELICQIAILGQMGLLVPAEEAHLGLFEEIYFFAKSRGMISAGALEATLKKFAKIASTAVPKLVLFDEIEAMTESGAAAKIIAGILDILAGDGNSCVVLVSHLAGEISKRTKSKIRIDGIEAKGLDDELNLIVDRSPRFNYLAKSTPELIVERLYKLAKIESEKRVYKQILDEFR